MRAAHYLACGFNIRRSLRMAGYSWGVANRGKAAIRHSQLLQRAILTVLDQLGNGQPQAYARGALLTAIMEGRDDPVLTNLLSPFPALDFSNIRTEYYGRQRRLVFVLAGPRSS